MIGLSNTVKDENGLLWLSNAQVTADFNLSARIIRSTTLDGDVIFTHLGATEKDRNLEFDCFLSPGDIQALKSFHLTGAEILLTFWEGAFLCLIAQIDASRDGKARLKFYIKEKIIP